MNNKRLGRIAMRHAEKYNLLPKEQYGSRKRHRSITCLLNKVLICNISRQLCLPLALTSNDAVKCYDYMIHNATSLSIQAAGIPHQPITAMFTVLQNAQHFVLTAFGKSKQSCGGRKRQLKNELPLMGVGQGNGAGPAAYAFLSAILIKVLASLGYGAVFTTALSLITFNTVCSMFVDDCDLWQSATDVNEKGEDVVGKMQEAVATWEGCLAASGGALSPQKSFWYLIDYRWTGDQWVYRTKEEMTATVQMHDEQGTLQTLQRHEPAHPEKSLGMLTAPDGSMESFKLDKAGEQIRVGQIPYLQEKVKEFTTKIKSAQNTLCTRPLQGALWTHSVSPHPLGIQG